MPATNNILLILDMIKGLIAIILGNIGLPPMVRYLIGILQPTMAVPLVMDKMGISVVCLIFTIYAFHKTHSKIIRALVTLCLFVPIILMLLSYFTVLKVPLPF
jgi:hypothetical protein